MRQKTFSSLGFDVHAKQTRRHRFLDEMDAIVPWSKLFRLRDGLTPKVHRHTKI